MPGELPAIRELFITTDRTFSTVHSRSADGFFVPLEPPPNLLQFRYFSTITELHSARSSIEVSFAKQPPDRLLWVADEGERRKARGFYLASTGLCPEASRASQLNGYWYYAFKKGQTWDTDDANKSLGYLLTTGGVWKLSKIEYDFCNSPVFTLLEMTEDEQIKPAEKTKKSLPMMADDLLRLFQSLRIHPRIVKVSEQAFAHGLYAEAILNAFKEVVVVVREITGLDSDGNTLMEQAFSLKNPRIKLNDITTPSGKDEQLGFMRIFSGVVLGIRNPKAHENIIQNDPYKTIEYLCLASLLLKRIDERLP